MATENQVQLLEHALNLFARYGYDAVGVQELARAAGVTKPTLYHYFGSKRGMLEAVLVQGGAPFTADLRAATDYTGDLPRSLRRVVASYARLAHTDPHFYRLLLTCSLAPPESEPYGLARAHLSAQHGLVEAMFKAAANDHGNMRGRSHRYATSLIGLISSYLTLELSGELTFDDTLEHDLVQRFSYGIYT